MAYTNKFKALHQTTTYTGCKIESKVIYNGDGTYKLTYKGFYTNTKTSTSNFSASSESTYKYFTVGGESRLIQNISYPEPMTIYFELSPLTKDDIGKTIYLSKSESDSYKPFKVTAGTNNYWTRVRLNTTITSDWFNSAPMINGSSVSTNNKLNPYEKNTPFSFNYTVNDTDVDDILVVKEYLDGTLLKTRSNAIRNTTYTIDIDKDTLYSLSETGVHTISISVSDGSNETTNNYKFIRTNLVPVITVLNGISDTYKFNANSPSVTYQASDPEGESITASILIDDVVVEEPVTIEQNTNITSSLSHDNWLRIRNGVHKFTLLVEDAQGGQAKQDYTFTKNETVMEFTLKEPILTGRGADNSRVEKYYNVFNKDNINSYTIYVCNNAYDDNPTWEQMTESPHVFTNSTKTADKWGFNIKFTTTRTNEVGDMRFYGMGGSLI